MPPTSDVDDIIRSLTEKVREAYARGYRDGAAATRDRILRAAADEGSVRSAEPERVKEQLSEDGMSTSARVERGAVRVAVQSVLARKPGLSINDISKRVTALDPRITSGNSVYNELSRNENKLYRRSAGLWFAIPMGEFREDPTQSAGSSQSNGVASNGA